MSWHDRAFDVEDLIKRSRIEGGFSKGFEINYWESPQDPVLRDYKRWLTSQKEKDADTERSDETKQQPDDV